MKLSTKKPSWIRVTPTEKMPDVSLEIRIFNNEEGLEFDGDVRVGRLLREMEVEVPVDPKDESKGTKVQVQKVWDYYSPLARSYLRRYVQKVQGLEIDDVVVKTMDDLFDQGTGHHPNVTMLCIRTLQELFDHNTVTEEEGKNSGAPSGDSGAAQKQATGKSPAQKRSSKS